MLNLSPLVAGRIIRSEEDFHFDLKGLREAVDDFQGWVSEAPLDATYVGAVETGAVGQSFLAQPRGFSQASDLLAKLPVSGHEY